jgi:hypothetical protein
MHTRFVVSRGRRVSLVTLTIAIILAISLLVNLYYMYHSPSQPRIVPHNPYNEEDLRDDDHVDHCHGCEQTICPECPPPDGNHWATTLYSLTHCIELPLVNDSLSFICANNIATCGDRLTTMEHNLVGALGMTS